MKLAICTDVFADLSYTDMLDKVKSLGIDAVEMTAGGWGARKHCNTAELLADEGKRKEFMGELEKRGMRISALNTSCNPLWPSKTGEEYKKSMYDCATLAGLHDFTQQPLGHGGHGQIFLTACRLDQVFDQAVHADNLLVRSIPQRQMLSFSFDPLQHVFDRTECSCMNLHVFFIEQTQKPAQLPYAVRAFAIYFSVESSITKHARPFSLA